LNYYYSGKLKGQGQGRDHWDLAERHYQDLSKEVCNDEGWGEVNVVCRRKMIPFLRYHLGHLNVKESLRYPE